MWISRKAAAWMAAVGLAAAAVAVIARHPAAAERVFRAMRGEAYAGSASCRECHEGFYQRWEPSHHGKAMQPVSSADTNAAVTGCIALP